MIDAISRRHVQLPHAPPEAFCNVLLHNAPDCNLPTGANRAGWFRLEEQSVRVTSRFVRKRPFDDHSVTSPQPGAYTSIRTATSFEAPISRAVTFAMKPSRSQLASL
jgi:hypothetical protein